MTALNVQVVENEERERGRRAEEVAGFYLKLQGFFTLANFALHKDRAALDLSTEADFLAIRLEHSCEHVARRRLKDCQKLARILGGRLCSAFLIVEVKASTCALNPTWDFQNDPRAALDSHLYVIKRMGIVPVSKADEIAAVVAQTGRWEGPEGVVQFICVGSEAGSVPASGRPVILFREIANFLVDRFQPLLPLKIPERPEGLRAWGEFGYGVAEFLRKHRGQGVGVDAVREELAQAVGRYVQSGSSRLGLL